MSWFFGFFRSLTWPDAAKTPEFIHTYADEKPKRKPKKIYHVVTRNRERFAEQQAPSMSDIASGALHIERKIYEAARRRAEEKEVIELLMLMGEL